MEPQHSYVVIRRKGFSLKNNETKIIFFLQKFGITSGLLWILITRLFQIIKSPVSATIQLLLLSPHDQGIWYTFGSLGALTVFAELGFTQIITQFVSHEYAHLSYTDGIICGEPYSLNRFFLLIKYALKFYLVIIPIAIIGLSIIGMNFFSRENVSVVIAWGIYSLAGGLTLLVSLFQAIYLGLDKVVDIQKNILANNILTTLIMWGFLLIGTGIFALAISSILSSIITVILLYRLCPKFWKQIKKSEKHARYNWGKEIIPLQWKYAIGFISSYFSIQLIVPTVYRIDGNILSGQLGITMMLIAILRQISDAFIDAHFPRLNILIAQKKEQDCFNLFSHLFLCRIGINILGGIAIVLFTKMIYSFPIGVRFLNIKLTILLVLFNIPINIIGALISYTIIHKDASVHFLTILIGMAGALAMLLIYPRYDLNTAFMFLVICFWFLILPLNIIFFLYKKRLFIKAII
jgi:O-antigen/teichoic acid export membrane protein